MEPRGATEIQHELLEKHVPKELLDKFQICTSIPGKIPLKIKIVLKNMIGMFLIHIGTTKNLDIFLTYLMIDQS